MDRIPEILNTFIFSSIYKHTNTETQTDRHRDTNRQLLTNLEQISYIAYMYVYIIYVVIYI